jgi:hypothetical protein
MSQNALVLPTTGTLSGTTLVTDINSALDTLNTVNLGSSAPATTEGGMLWNDTGTNALWRRNAANSAWIKLGSFDEANDLFHPANAFKALNTQVFTSSGTYTPTAGMVYCVIEAVGGGGSGSTTNLNSGGGGGGGAYGRAVFTAVTIGASQAVTIGAGGVSVTASAGNAGGTTSVGSLISAGGGTGGGTPGAVGAVGVTAGGPGGSTTTGATVTGAGGAGTFGIYISSAYLTGTGGSSHFGGGGYGIVASGNAPGNAGLYGGGGGGGAGTSGSGAGGNGLVVITEYLSS